VRIATCFASIAKTTTGVLRPCNASGAAIPPLGRGTFGSDRAGHAEVAEAVHLAIGRGYRHINCAAVYGNEVRIGGVLASGFSGTAGYAAVAWQDLLITSKLWNDMHAPERASISVRKTLADRRLEYVDLYLVHWPFRNFHPPGCNVSSRSPHATPYGRERFMETWGELERMVDAGLVRHIATSNLTIPKLALLLHDARIKPFANEMELHPNFQQPELSAFVVGNGIIPVGYSPLQHRRGVLLCWCEGSRWPAKPVTVVALRHNQSIGCQLPMNQA
jgi:alcohol dehydrogenase (NADP+)